LPEGTRWADLSLWQKTTNILTTEYTIWAAFLGSTFITLATHGTDQDMVQRMLTARNKRQSAAATILSGIADIPVTAAVIGIGILLYVFYTHIQIDPNLPMVAGKPDSSQIFPYFVVDVMPGGLRGLVIAGVLATTMGSLGTALNSLATSYSRDFHFRWFKTAESDERGRVRIIRIATVAFAVVLIGVGLLTAFVKATNPSLSIIPIILGSFGYTYGSLLGIFMVALFTKNRGSDFGNIIAMAAGFLVVGFLSDLHTDVVRIFAGSSFSSLKPDWIPTIKFPWRIMIGTIVTAAVALCFATKDSERLGTPDEV
jgi:Na+/proline symporter